MHLQPIRPPSPPRKKKTEETAVDPSILEKFRFRADDENIFKAVKEGIPEPKPKEKNTKRTIDIKKLKNRKKYEDIDDLFGGIDIRKDNLKSADKDIKYQEIDFKPKVKKEVKAPIEVKSHRDNNTNETVGASTKSRSDKVFKIPKEKNLIKEKIAPPPRNVSKLTHTVKKPISPIKKAVPVPSKPLPIKKSQTKKVVVNKNKIRKVEEQSSEDEDDRSSDSEEYSNDYPEDDSGSDVEDKIEYYKTNYREFIRKTFGYDRNDPKYLIRDRMRLEDVGFDEVEKEERKSYLLGLKEDREERLKEEMRKKKKKAAKKKLQ